MRIMTGVVGLCLFCLACCLRLSSTEPGTGAAASLKAATPTPSVVLFPETGHTLRGAFLEYWQTHGGLPQQGFPISEEMDEISDLDGKQYRVQYFERAVFEYHPENQPPYDVLLSQLGTFRYKAKYGDAGAPAQHANPLGIPFKETGHFVGGVFLKYWQEHGGLAQQGFPISEEFEEVSALDGKLYTVQYFERAVFEWHPENAAPYDVLLSQLGTFRGQEKYPNGMGNGSTAEPTKPPATPGTGNCEPVADARKSAVGSTGDLKISNVQYAGQEYVDITNAGAASADLSGWTLRDKNDTDQQFRFAGGTILAAGATIQVYTEPGHPYSFNSRNSIWNNCGDALELVNSSGVVVATYAYGTHLK